MKNKDRKPKPQYFWERYQSAKTEDKKAYFKDRLSQMGLDPELDELHDTEGDICVIGKGSTNSDFKTLLKWNWKTGQKVNK